MVKAAKSMPEAGTKERKADLLSNMMVKMWVLGLITWWCGWPLSQLKRFGQHCHRLKCAWKRSWLYPLDSKFKTFRYPGQGMLFSMQEKYSKVLESGDRCVDLFVSLRSPYIQVINLTTIYFLWWQEITILSLSLHCSCCSCCGKTKW